MKAHMHRPQLATAATVLVAIFAVSCSDDESAHKSAAAADAGSGVQDTLHSKQDTATDTVADSAVTDSEKTEKPAPARAFRPATKTDLVGGPHAALDHTANDVVLDNGLVRFVIRGAQEGVSMYGTTGGQLVDAARIGPVAAGKTAAETPAPFDHLRELIFTLDARQVRPDTITILAAGGDVASVRVEGPLVPMPTLKEALNLQKPSLAAYHTYTLKAGSPVLEMRTHVSNTGTGTTSVMAVDVAAWGGEQTLWLAGFGDTDLPTATGTSVLGYGLRRLAGTSAAMRVEHALASAGKLVMLDSGAFRAFMHAGVVATAEGVDIVRYLAVGGTEGTDLAAAMAAAEAARGPTKQRIVAGIVADSFAGTVVVVLDGAGKPRSRCLVDATGSFRCPITEDAVTLRTGWLGDGGVEPGNGAQTDPTTDTPIPADAGKRSSLSLTAPTASTLQVQAQDIGASGANKALPVRVTLTPVQPDGKPGAKARYRVFAVAEGSGTHRVPVGDYEVTVHHGPFYSEHREKVTLGAGKTITITAKLRRVVDTAGWVSVDTHVHTEASADGDVTIGRRLAGAAAEDIRYVIATDHDHITDYADFAAYDATVSAGACGSKGGAQGWAVGVGKLAGSVPSATVWTVPGMELTTMKAGHFNAWPAKPVAWYEAPAAELLNLLGVTDAGRTVQCNHPRDESFSYWDAINFDAQKTDAKLLRCHALEVINGFNPKPTAAVIDDWLALLGRGVTLVATGSSDSHHTDKLLGNARTLVFVGAKSADPCATTAAQIDAALRTGKVIASAGPMLTVAAGIIDEKTGKPGQEVGVGATLIAGASDKITARVVLQAPEWMPLGELRIYVSNSAKAGASGGAAGEPVALPIIKDASKTTIEDGARRFEVSLPIAATGTDQHIVAVHVGTSVTTPQPGLRVPPWAISNPVWIRRQ